jgi:hypothetical protein
MDRDFFLVIAVFVMGVALIATGLYALVLYPGIPEPGPGFIVLVTVAPGLYLVYLGIRSLRKMHRGVDPWYSE